VLTLDSTPLLPVETETLGLGLSREWFHERQLVLYKLTAVTPLIIEIWMNAVQDALNAWQKDRPYRAVHDLSHPGVSLQYAALVNFDMMNIGVTLEGRIYSERLFDAHPDWSARVAVNFNLSLSGQTNRTLMSYLNRDHPAIRYKSFYNRTKCIKWAMGETGDTAEIPKLET
jgi:hypothetical protein